MNRQVGPSIVLSVLIVCFFAVALFQNDRPRSVADRAQSGAGDSIAGGARNPRSSALDRPSPRAPSTAATGSMPENVAVPLRPRPDASGRSIAEFKPQWDRSSPATAEPPRETAGSRPAKRTDEARQPSSAFIVVRAAETIHEVALRVYGSTDQVDTLWRANRDALPRRDSAVYAGMVLRTPSIR